MCGRWRDQAEVDGEARVRAEMRLQLRARREPSPATRGCMEGRGNVSWRVLYTLYVVYKDLTESV